MTDSIQKCPAIDMQMAGNYVPAFVEGFHDQCKVRAAAFCDGGMSVALVGTGTLVIPEGVVKASYDKTRVPCGISTGLVMIRIYMQSLQRACRRRAVGKYDGVSELICHLPITNPRLPTRVISTR